MVFPREGIRGEGGLGGTDRKQGRARANHQDGHDEGQPTLSRVRTFPSHAARFLATEYRQ
jgi:hypothetical protein